MPSRFTALRARWVAGLAFALALALASWSWSPGAAAAGEVVVLRHAGPIGPAAAAYVDRGLAAAAERGAALVVLEMDTPGGLDTSMRHIIKAILASPVPVATFVAPSGARAASAGVYILYASHLAAMTAGTNLGAATPVEVGVMPGGQPEQPAPAKRPAKDGDKGAAPSEPSPQAPSSAQAMRNKVVNDAVAYLRGLAQMRGRNEAWAERAVREAVSLPATEAVEANVVDFLARDVPDLLAKADGRKVQVAGTSRTVSVAGAAIVEMPPDWKNELLAVITNPTVAMILLLLGVYGLIFEFNNPGLVAPGVVGAIALLLGLFSMHLLPINYAGLALMLLGIAFVIAEAFVPSFGALGIGGAIAFVLGAVMLLDTDAPGFALPLAAIVPAAVLFLGLVLLTAGLAARAHGRPVVSGREQLIGAHGEVIDSTDGGAWARVESEIWRARCDTPLARGARVRVTAIDGLVLHVVPEDR